jgi:hypothetical protein
MKVHIHALESATFVTKTLPEVDTRSGSYSYPLNASIDVYAGVED